MQVNVSEEDEFQLLITACLSVLILGTETKLDAALVQMTRLPWASLESVRSPFQVQNDNLLYELAPWHLSPLVSGHQNRSQFTEITYLTSPGQTQLSVAYKLCCRLWCQLHFNSPDESLASTRLET